MPPKKSRTNTTPPPAKISRVPYPSIAAESDEDDNRSRDNADGGWVGRHVKRKRGSEDYELDENDRRIPLKVSYSIYKKTTYLPQGTVTTDSQYQFGDQQNHRKRRKKRNTEDDYFSQGSGGDSDSGGTSNGGNPSESDDEGDLFAQSYKEYSGLECTCKDGQSCKGKCNGQGIDENVDPREGASKDTGSHPSHTGGEGHPRNSDDDHNNASTLEGEAASQVAHTQTGTTGNARSDNDAKSYPVSPPNVPDNLSPFVHKSRLLEEVFEVDPDNPNWNFVTYSTTLKNGIKYTQRDRVPAFRKNAPKDEIPKFKLYPENAEVPNPHDKEKDVPWAKKAGGSGDEYVRGKLTWKPAGIMRKFREDTGEYIGAMKPLASFEKMLKEGLSEKATIGEYNARTSQRFRRLDDERKGKNKKEHWKDDEYKQVVQAFNEQILRDGLVSWAENYDANMRAALGRLNGYRTGNPKKYPQGKRTAEAIRAMLSRKGAVKTYRKEGDALKESKAKVTDLQLKPKDAFKLEHFKVEKNSKRNSKKNSKEKGEGEDDEEDDSNSDEQ